MRENRELEVGELVRRVVVQKGSRGKVRVGND